MCLKKRFLIINVNLLTKELWFLEKYLFIMEKYVFFKDIYNIHMVWGLLKDSK